MTPVFDGHNDSLTCCEPAEFAAGRADGHLDVPRARRGGFAGGVFAIFTPTPGDEPEWPELAPYDMPPAEPLAQPDALAHAATTAGKLFTLEAMGVVRVVRGTADLDRSQADGRIAAVLHLEGAEAIDPGLGNLDAWYEAGLRSLGPVWSRPNAFAHGVPFRFPGSPDEGPGLTADGERLVRRCNELGIVVDTSHLNEAGFWDVARISTAPLVASHSGAHALSPASRNLTDEQLDAFGTTGGLVGVVFAVGFLRADGAYHAATPLDAIVAHARHVAERIGVDHVALGSDFDGAVVPAELGDAAGLPRLLGALREGGFTDAEVERIAWGNWRRVLGASWTG
ncbi:MAG TPA: dipeptidase [Solirubrobacteraceae bacterium]|nr:dipeptidase [Solirubrobacteraceae bacterium]